MASAQPHSNEEIHSRLLAPYPLALLQLMDEEASADNPPLGTATLVTTEREFLVALGKCGVPVVEALAEAVCRRTCADPPGDWAAMVHQQLQEPHADLTHLTQLGSHYLSHLVIAFRNPGGKKTPQDTVHPTPNLKGIEEIEELLRTATIRRSQSALKDLVALRDGLNCLLTGVSFVPPMPVTARCAHIIPFSVATKLQTHAAIETFTGYTLDADLNLQNDAHDSMDKYMAWGIEANFSDNRWRYYYRIVRRDLVSPFTKLADGGEIVFGNGIGGSKVPPLTRWSSTST